MSTLDEGPYCHRLDKVSLRQGKWHMWGTKGGQAEGVQEEWESLGLSWLDLIPILEVTIRLKIQSIRMDLKSNDSRFKNR